jgi:ABC-type antimicrobial peptide transport system permease subunit
VIVAARRELQAIDANVPVTAVKTVAAQIDEKLSSERLLTHLLTGFALLSVVLVAIGLYGVLACSVARRTREIGVRMALGADAARLFGLVVRESFLVVVLGLLLGVPAALAICRVTASILYGVSYDDAISLAGAALVMAVVALTAACLPARRATKVDPIVALRSE